MNGIQKANAQSHTHMQFASANATAKIAKEYVLPTLTFGLNNIHPKIKQDVEIQLTTMYKNNSANFC